MADWHSVTDTNSKTTDAPPPLAFSSRRSSVICRHGCVSSSQPLASSIGLQILRDKGGNAADAAVAIAAALAVLEPCSTGLGGDMFALYYDASIRRVGAVNGSGRCPHQLTLDRLKEDSKYCLDGKDGRRIDEDKFKFSPHSVTVPGAAMGWEDFYHRYGSGSLSFAELLEPAAILAEEGFPVAPVTAHHWCSGLNRISRWVEDGKPIPMTVDGIRGPNPGDIFTNPQMARVLRDLGQHGARRGFYEGETGKAIVDILQKLGGCMTMDDLKAHQSTYPDPISVQYRDCRLWQVPPNGQGIAGLIALEGINALESRGLLSDKEQDKKEQRLVMMNNGAQCWSSSSMHGMIEMMRLGFGDARSFVACPNQPLDIAAADAVSSNEKDSQPKPRDDVVPVERLLDSHRIAERAERLFDPNRAIIHGEPLPTSCTVSFQVVDGQGNAVSFVNSNFLGFGSGIVPHNCGFSLQNRGFGFSLDPQHPNALHPGRRPYHTIIPGMLTHEDTNELFATISNMGGYMQPQGHLQLTLGLVAAGLDPQTAVDLPRFCIATGTQGGDVFIEDGFDDGVVEELKSMGHKLKSKISGHSRSLFGRAQIIKRDRSTGVLWAGSDGRADGCAMGY